jgi:hypothetical protein
MTITHRLTLPVYALAGGKLTPTNEKLFFVIDSEHTKHDVSRAE